MEENKIKNSYPRISQSPFDFLTRGVGKKHLQRSRFTLMKGRREGGNIELSQEGNEFAVFNNTKKPSLSTA